MIKKIDEIHFQDVVASLYGRDVLFNIIEKISKKNFVNVSSRGGIKDVNEVDQLLRIGVDKIVINSAAVKSRYIRKLSKNLWFLHNWSKYRYIKNWKKL